MKVQGALAVTTGGEQRHCIEFPVAFKGVPSFAFAVTTPIVDGPIACSTVVTGWRCEEGEEIVKAAWLQVWVDGGADDAVITVNYVFEGEAANDGPADQPDHRFSPLK